MEAKTKHAMSTDAEQAAIQAAVQEIEGKMAERVSYMAPLDMSGRNNDDMFVRVNDETFQIQRGVRVEIPRYVLEVLENSDKQALLSMKKIGEFSIS